MEIGRVAEIEVQQKVRLLKTGTYLSGSKKLVTTKTMKRLKLS